MLPFNRFPDADSVLGPEMRSTGEVMGIDTTFGLAFAKSQLAAGDRLPESGCVFMSLADRDKAAGIEAARRFVKAGFTIAATAGTADALEADGIPVATRVAKVGEPTGTDAVELISSGRSIWSSTARAAAGARADGAHIRAAAAVHGIPCLTTAAAGLAAANGILDRAAHELTRAHAPGVPRRHRPRPPAAAARPMSRPGSAAVDLTTTVGSVRCPTRS